MQKWIIKSVPIIVGLIGMSRVFTFFFPEWIHKQTDVFIYFSPLKSCYTYKRASVDQVNVVSTLARLSLHGPCLQFRASILAFDSFSSRSSAFAHLCLLSVTQSFFRDSVFIFWGRPGRNSRPRPSSLCGAVCLLPKSDRAVPLLCCACLLDSLFSFSLSSLY